MGEPTDKNLVRPRQPALDEGDLPADQKHPIEVHAAEHRQRSLGTRAGSLNAAGDRQLRERPRASRRT